MDYDLEEYYASFLEALVRNIDAMDVVHYGVKGMRWGVRKAENGAGGRPARSPLKSLGPDRVVTKTASGDVLELRKAPVTSLHRGLARISKGYQKAYEKNAILTIHDKTGKKVGEASVAKKNSEELYLNWLGIKGSERGKGYATAVMKAGEEFGRQQGFKRMTLEVPGNAPDARHIYTKLGFKVVREPSEAEKNDMWGGLTDMVYEFGDAKHMDVVDVASFLEHYGVKGMRWGVRRADTSGPVRVTQDGTRRPKASGGGNRKVSADAKEALKAKQIARASGVHALSNRELQAFVTRANLEKQYSSLNPTALGGAKKFVADTILGVGKDQARKVAADFAAKQVANVFKK